MAQHSSPARRPSQGRAFTLIELLVVVSIIALMIAILLPALKKAREVARSMACQSQMRQLGIAMTVYTNDNPTYPTLAQTSWDKGVWSVLLFPYLNHMKNDFRQVPIYYCPSDQYYPYADWITSTYYGQRSYSMNMGISDQVGIYAGDQLDWNGYKGGRAPGEIVNASSKIMMVEAHHWRNWIGFGSFGAYTWKYGYWWGYKTIGGLGNTDGIDTFGEEHQGGANYLYVDGHVTSTSMRDMERWVVDEPSTARSSANPWLLDR